MMASGDNILGSAVPSTLPSVGPNQVLHSAKVDGVNAQCGTDQPLTSQPCGTSCNVYNAIKLIVERDVGPAEPCLTELYSYSLPLLQHQQCAQRIMAILKRNYPQYAASHLIRIRTLIMQALAVEPNMNDYENPPSVASSTGGKLGGNGKNNTVLRLEKGKNGKLLVKGGQKVWDCMPIDLQEDIEAHFSREGEGSGDNTMGERIFTEVREFCSSEAVPNVKELRRMIPKTVLLIFHTDLVAEGREKIRDMWDMKYRPDEWRNCPDFPPFADPNNGSKLQKNDLMKVYTYLKNIFQERELMFRTQLGLDIQHQRASPWQRKVMATLHRMQREVDHVLSKVALSPDAKSSLEGLRAFLDKIHIDDDDVLQVCDVTSAVQRLMLEIEMCKKPHGEIGGCCNKIQSDFDAGQTAYSTVQPSSEDVGQQYMQSIQSSPLAISTDPILELLPVSEESIILDLKDTVLTDTFPDSVVQSITSDSIDALISSPAQAIDTDTDMLATLCKDFDLDATLDDFDIPSKKLKINHDNFSTSGNTIMDGIVLREINNGSFEYDLMQQLYCSPVVQQVVEEHMQQVEAVHSSTKNVEMTQSSKGPGSSYHYSQTKPFSNTAPPTQMTFGREPMIPLTVLGMSDMEVD